MLERGDRWLWVVYAGRNRWVKGSEVCFKNGEEVQGRITPV